MGDELLNQPTVNLKPIEFPFASGAESRIKALAPAGALCVPGGSGSRAPSTAATSSEAYFVRAQGMRRPKGSAAGWLMLRKR